MLFWISARLAGLKAQSQTLTIHGERIRTPISACNRLLYPSIISNLSYDEITDGLLGIRTGHHVIFHNIMDNDDVMVIRILHESYEADQSLPIKPLRDDFIQIYFGKHQTTIGNHSHRILVKIPYLS